MEKLKNVKDLQDFLDTGDIGEQITEYNNGYISDIFTEIADNNVDIYTSDLFDWAKYNSSYIDEAVAEFGRPDTMEQEIRQGQFLYYEQDLYNFIEDILKYWAYNYIMNQLEKTEITEAENEAIEFLNWHNFDKLEEIEEELKNIFNCEEE